MSKWDERIGFLFRLFCFQVVALCPLEQLKFRMLSVPRSVCRYVFAELAVSP